MAASNKKNGDNTSKCNNGKKFNEVVDAKDPTKQQQQQNKLNSIFGAEVFGSGAPSDINTPANAAVTGTANDKFADADTGRDFARPEASLLPATNQTSGAEKAVKVDEDQKDGKVLVTNRKVKFAICPRVINGTKSSALPKPVSAHASINNTSNKNLVTNLGGKTKFKAKHSIAPMQSRPVATFTKTGSAVRTSPITETCNTTIERQEQALPSTKSLTLTSIAARTVAHKGNFRVHSLIPIRCKSTLGKVAPAVASYSLLAVPMVDNPDKSDPSGNDDNQKNDLGNRRSNDAAENNRESGNRARNSPNGASSTNSNNNSNIPNGNSNTGNANVRNRNAENCVGQDCTKTEYGNSVSNSSRKRKINEENTAKTNDTAAAAGPSTSTKAAEEDDKDKEEDKDAKKKKNRCAECRKKVGLTGFQCRCGGLFCAVHRYSDKHDCTFNYREHGAQEIRRNNPVVVGEKIQKI